MKLHTMRNDCRCEEDFHHNKYCSVAAAVVGSAVVGAVGSSMQAGAASDAADAQSASAQAQIAESRRQFDEIQKLLSPYTNAGPGALARQQDFLGLNGPGAQFDAVNGVAASPEMAYLTQQGENSILQNASATGGLRGGNTQAALAQFRPALLNSLIDKQYSRLGGLTTLGQNSAAGVGSAGQFTSGQINNAYQQQGAAQAGGALAQGKAYGSALNGLGQAAGLAFGSGGIGNLFGGAPQSNVTLGTNYGDGSATSFGGAGSGFETFGNQGWGAY